MASEGQHPQNVGSSVPIAAVGRVVFTSTSDSDGSFTGSWKGMAGGIPIRTAIEGTYHVNPDCTGTMTDSDGVISHEITIANGGAEIDFSLILSTDEPRTGSGFMKRQ